MTGSETTSRQATEHLDESTTVIYLEVPRRGVVLLQGYFELYEGLGMVRTLSASIPGREEKPRKETPLGEEGARGDEPSLICILTSPSQAQDCHTALEQVRTQVGWAYYPSPPDTPEGRSARDMYFGNCTNATDIT
jgi:hypothetical protein